MRYNDRRLKTGYSDLGRLIIPVLPSPIILTDRDDGTLWVLSFDTSAPTVDGYGHISINSDIRYFQRNEVAKVYPADDGPVLGPYVLFIRAGRIGLDYTAYDIGETDRDGSPVYARKRGVRTFRQVYVTHPENPEIVHLAWTPDEEHYG